MFRQLRLAEIEDTIGLLRRFKPSGDLLEIGAGTGWQSKALSEAGYKVEAIDLPATIEISNHAQSREWPIRDYDGSRIPLDDASVDVLYSSNVLEHVTDLQTLTGEMKRVLRPGGVALHLLPNTTWRALSLATYYPAQAIDAIRWIRRRRRHVEAPSESSPQDCGDVPAVSTSLVRKAVKRLLPRPHGAEGNAVTELARFTKASWDQYFERFGWDVLFYGNNGILASGDYLFGEALPLRFRRQLGSAIGGIAHVYVVTPKAC